MRLLLVLLFSNLILANANALVGSDIKFYSAFLDHYETKFSKYQCSKLFIDKNLLLLENTFRNELPLFVQKSHDSFDSVSDIGFWKFRSKGSGSIDSKLKAKGFKLESDGSNLSDAKKLISDGVAARFVIEDTSADGIERIFKQIKKKVLQGELDIIEIKNYRGAKGQPYIDDTALISLGVESWDKNRKSIALKLGEDALQKDGYTGLHLKVRLANGTVSEIQFRGELIHQYSEVMHIFYDSVKGKRIAPEFVDNIEVKKIVETFQKFNDEQFKQYNKYVQDYYNYLRQMELGKIDPRGPPEFPSSLIKYGNTISMHNIFKNIQPYYNSTVYRNTLRFDQYNAIPQIQRNKIFDSVKKVKNKNPDAMMANVQSGNNIRVKLTKEVSTKVKKLEKEVKGLKHTAVIIWEENPYTKLRRTALRKKQPWADPYTVPKFDESQALGEATLNIKDVHYMQAAANHASGEYTVIGNAHAIKNGSLKPEDLPPLEVWRDTSGKVWSMDHRRLIAYELSGVVDKVPVKFVAKEFVDIDNFKHQNLDGGKSIILQIKGTNLGVLIEK